MEKTSKQFVTIAMMVLAGAVVGKSEIAHAALNNNTTNNSNEAVAITETSESVKEVATQDSETSTTSIESETQLPYSVHTVVAGESLYSISARYATTIETIKQANAMISNFIYPGQQLMVPHTQTETAPVAPVVSEKQEAPVVTPTIFDTLSQAVTYAKANFDYTKHHNWYVDYTAKGYVVRLEEKNNSVRNNVQKVTKEETQTPSTATHQLYTVVSGDYLYKIAQRYGTTVDALKQANNLTSNFIQIGDKLVIPSKQVATTPVVKPTVTPTVKRDTPKPVSHQLYTVVSGDYLYKIAQRYGTTVDALKQANNLTSNFIQIGDKLVIPSKQVATTPVVTKPVVSPHTPSTSKEQFSTLNEAVRYAKANFDMTKHDNWYVNYKESGYVVKFAPKEKVVATPKRQTTTKHYTVKSGDSLWAISRRFGTTIQQLKAMNNLKNNMIHPGDRLVVG